MSARTHVRAVADVYKEPPRARIPMEKINAYKESELRKQAPPSLAWRIASALGGRARIDAALGCALFGAFMLFLISAISTGIAVVVLILGGGTLWGFAITYVTFALFGATVLFNLTLRGINWLRTSRITLRGPCIWKELPLYTQTEIPPFVQRIVYEERMRNPDATFSVDSLMRDDIVIDPILYEEEASPTGEKIKEALCVWDEDGKEVKL